MNQIKNKTIFNLILLFSIFALITVYFIEYILGHQPCNLCLIERIPYILAILLITIFFIFKKNEKIYLFLLTLVFASASLISFYHFGIEQEFIEESLVCNTNVDNLDLSKENLLKKLQEKTISCKDVSFRIFGLSLASINTVISITFSAILFNLFFKYDKNK